MNTAFMLVAENRIHKSRIGFVVLPYLKNSPSNRVLVCF